MALMISSLCRKAAGVGFSEMARLIAFEALDRDSPPALVVKWALEIFSITCPFDLESWSDFPSSEPRTARESVNHWMASGKLFCLTHSSPRWQRQSPR